MSRRILGASCALVLSLTLAACGGATTSTTTTTASAGPISAPTTAASDGGAATSSPAASDDHNAVDVMFVTMMIPHHEGAIEMSDVALTQASTPQVKDLAARIKAAQGPEIQQMQGWLADWAAAMPMTSAAGDMGHGMGGEMGHGSATTVESAPGSAVDDFGMGGMMTMGEADLAVLRAATGVEFDKLFLQQMIAHHQGAIDMAEVETAQGQHAQTLVLAEAIKTGQTSEIAEMQQLLSAL